MPKKEQLGVILKLISRLFWFNHLIINKDNSAKQFSFQELVGLITMFILFIKKLLIDLVRINLGYA